MATAGRVGGLTLAAEAGAASVRVAAGCCVRPAVVVVICGVVDPAPCWWTAARCFWMVCGVCCCGGCGGVVLVASPRCRCRGWWLRRRVASSIRPLPFPPTTHAPQQAGGAPRTTRSIATKWKVFRRGFVQCRVTTPSLDGSEQGERLAHRADEAFVNQQLSSTLTDRSANHQSIIEHQQRGKRKQKRNVTVNPKGFEPLPLSCVPSSAKLFVSSITLTKLSSTNEFSSAHSHFRQRRIDELHQKLYKR